MEPGRLQATAELKKGSLELLVLSVLATMPRHGYEIGRLIELRSGGHLQFRISTLYPVLYRMENHGWIQGRWVERPGERRRCYYRLTEAAGGHCRPSMTGGAHLPRP